MLKILIVEGNTLASRRATQQAGSMTQDVLYQKQLIFLNADVECDVIFPADVENLNDLSFDLYDGILWTGSALNIYKVEEAVTRQIDFMRLCLSKNVKIFGSCWGLQVAVVAVGGQVAKNTNGLEIGIARDITQTLEGWKHPLFAGKSQVFDAVAVHLDHVVALPEDVKVLASNEMSLVQAIELKTKTAIFWGVQYHPEFDLGYIAGLFQKYERSMIQGGIVKDAAAIDVMVADFKALHANPEATELQEMYRLGGDTLDPCYRMQEIQNWLSFLKSASC